MDLSVFVLNFASGISMLLVIYAAYMMVRTSKGDFSNAFKIILLGHVPSAAIHFLNSLGYLGYQVLPDDTSPVYTLLIYGGQVISALSVFIAIYMVKRALLDKIVKFVKRVRGGGND